MPTATIDLPPADEIADLIPYLTADELKQLDLLSQHLWTDLPTDYSVYAADPVQFGMDVFGEVYTPQQVRVMEHVRDFPITIAESANATGKSHAAARIAVWWYKTREEAQVYTAAAPPLENLQRILWGEINYLVSHNENTVFADDKINFLHIARDSRNFITGVPIPSTGSAAQREAKFSGKHAQNLLFILDEGDAISPEVYSGIESCLSGGTGRLLVMYNPRSDQGPIAAMKARGVEVVRLSAFDHPNVITGRDIIPGAVSRNKTVHRIHKWTVPVDENAENITNYGRFQVPDFLVGFVGRDEETGQDFPPLPGGERLIIEPEFSYMVLGVYPGASKGVIFDTFLDDYDEAVRHGRRPLGNVTELADYEPGAGPLFWSIDDGYTGRIDPATGHFTADSHPRIIGMFQMKPDGRLCHFYELAKLKEPRPELQIREALNLELPYDPARVTPNTADAYFPLGSRLLLSHPQIGPGVLTRPSVAEMVLEQGETRTDIPFAQFYPFCQRAIRDGIAMTMHLPRPEFVVVGPGSAALGGILADMDLFKQNCMANVEESTKHLRRWMADDGKGWRRFQVHPRCRNFRYEAGRYRKDDNGRVIKAFDHSMDLARYMAWQLRNGV